MNPAPATSARASSGDRGSAATSVGRQLARIALERLGELQRDVGRIVAVLRLLRALERRSAAALRPARRGRARRAATRQVRDLSSVKASPRWRGSKAANYSVPRSREPRACRSGEVRADRHRGSSARGARRSRSSSARQRGRKACSARAIAALHQHLRALQSGAARRAPPGPENRPRSAAAAAAASARPCSDARARGTRSAARAFCASAASSARCANGGKPRGSRSASSVAAKRSKSWADERRVQRMLRKIGLHQHFAGQGRARPARPATCSSSANRRSVARNSRAVKRVVGAEDADQRQARKVVSLGEHLRADQDVDLARVDRHRASSRMIRLRRVLSRSTRRIRAAGNKLDERALEPLRAEAQRQQVLIAAVRAGARQALPRGRNGDSASSPVSRCTTSRAAQRGHMALSSRSRDKAATARSRAG